ncbi:Mariner Mos1 transposase [Eumeta japonica]|uniref:Mariner Mos1 transposase n=1 Tax=Eumeta variegata TaxID=151549 RepID=A0A4C1YVN3_EUMVA|nr:Mariner Mos1 transposase [Eumeta japonica]
MPISGLTRNKLTLCVCVWKDIIRYKFSPPGKCINSDLYCQQLLKLEQEVMKKRPESINRKGVVFHHDNTRPRTFLAAQRILKKFGWEVSMHSPYRPNLAPSDFHLFRSLQNSLDSVRLTSKEDCQNYLSQSIDQKSQNFYSNGIMPSFRMHFRGRNDLPSHQRLCGHRRTLALATPDESPIRCQPLTNRIADAED